MRKLQDEQSFPACYENKSMRSCCFTIGEIPLTFVEKMKTNINFERYLYYSKYLIKILSVIGIENNGRPGNEIKL